LLTLVLEGVIPAQARSVLSLSKDQNPDRFAEGRPGQRRHTGVLGEVPGFHGMTHLSQIGFFLDSVIDPRQPGFQRPEDFV
jgi:hypothetical protein